MFLRNEMKFLIIFLFLAAAASFGLAAKAPNKTESHDANPVSTASPTGKPNLPGKPDLPTTVPTGIPDSPTGKGKPDSPTGKTGLPTGIPDLPTGIPDLPTSAPTNSSGSPSAQEFADAVSKTANNPISAIGSLSAQCQTALVNIVANPEFFQCIPIQSLLPLLPATDPTVIKGILKDPVHKLPPLLKPVFDGICAAPKCSDEGISGALKAIKEGCKADGKNPLIVIATGLITFYSPLRDSICFKTNKGDYCVFDTLKKVLSLPKPPVAVTNTFIDNVAFAEPKAICTPCNKAILNTVVNFIDADTNKCVEFLAKLNVPVGLLPLAKLGVALKCGFQFLDGDAGHPEKTDPNDFEYQLSIGQDAPAQSGASNLKGIGFMTMIGVLLASILMI